MNKVEEQEQFEKEMESLGLQLIKQEDVEGSFGLSMEIDLDTEVDYTHLVNEDFVMKKLTKRKDFFYITVKKYDKELKRLTLSVGTPVTLNIFNYYKGAIGPKPFGTNFPDLCWYHAEGTTDLTKDEVETKFRDDAIMADLTWFLPSRMVDNFIEIMHTLNQSFLQGLMQDTICYGPFLSTDEVKA